MLISGSLLFVIILALLFNFINGMRDSSSIVATMISSRAFHPRTALGMTALAEFAGPFLFGTSVAKTIANDLVDSNALKLSALMACLLGAILWNLITWYWGIPSSSSHALAGGLLGAVIVSLGVGSIKLGGLYKVLLALLTTPVIGFVFGYLILRIIYVLAFNASPSINNFFKQGQLVTGISLAVSHGTNDSQKTMGIITLSLLISNQVSEFIVLDWVTFASAITMAVGAFFGGWRLIRTLGGKFYKIRPVHSFATQFTSAIVILSSSIIGLPVSTSQVISSSIIGVGASERFGKVRWGVAGDILLAWLITIPVSALFSAGIYFVLIKLGFV